MLDHACGNLRATLAERRDDLYETPPEAVRSLLAHEPLDRQEPIWEPACGPGAIVRELRGRGFNVIATDLVDYASSDQDEARIDFLMEYKLRAPVVLTNPPFKLAHEFVRHALDLGAQRVIILARLAFLESDARSDILDNGHLVRLWVYRRRLPMMHRADWVGRKANSGMAFAWFVWDRSVRGPALARRISWDR
jgi:hypothetical protein